MARNIDPGPGYRLLEFGEVIKTTDEYHSWIPPYEDDSREWVPTIHAGRTVAGWSGNIRRKQDNEYSYS